MVVVGNVVCHSTEQYIMTTELYKQYITAKYNFSLLEYLEELHKNNYWTKPELSVRMRTAERRSIRFIENHMRRITRET